MPGRQPGVAAGAFQGPNSWPPGQLQEPAELRSCFCADTCSWPAGYDFVLLGDEAGQRQSRHGSAESFTGELAIVPPALGASKALLNRDHHEAYYAGGALSAMTCRAARPHWAPVLSAAPAADASGTALRAFGQPCKHGQLLVSHAVHALTCLM